MNKAAVSVRSRSHPSIFSKKYVVLICTRSWKNKTKVQNVGRARSHEEQHGKVIASSLRCGCIESSTGVTAGFNQARSAEFHEILPSQDTYPV